MEHKGYKAKIQYSDEDRVFHGEVIGINDMITFEGDTVEALERDFREAVDDYLETCKEIGKQPERAYSGRIPLRINAQLHKRLAQYAEIDDMSLNAWLTERLEKADAQRAS